MVGDSQRRSTSLRRRACFAGNLAHRDRRPFLFGLSANFLSFMIISHKLIVYFSKHFDDLKTHLNLPKADSILGYSFWIESISGSPSLCHHLRTFSRFVLASQHIISSVDQRLPYDVVIFILPLAGFITEAIEPERYCSGFSSKYVLRREVASSTLSHRVLSLDLGPAKCFKNEEVKAAN